MPRAEFFRLWDFFVLPDFLDEQDCQRISAEMNSAAYLPAGIRRAGNTFGVNESIRSTKWATLSGSTISTVKTRLREVRPKLEDHFTVTLSGFEEPQFLVYREGDYYRAHQDSSSDPNAPDYIRERKVSIIIFLNNERHETSDGSFSGGSLTFYGLMTDPRMESRGFSLLGQEGLLVGFSPGTRHEVTPVSSGQRHTIATWFF